MVAVNQNIRDLADKIAAEFRPQRIVLFGSHARGNAGTESDVDLLVIMPIKGSRHLAAARIRARLTGRTPIDVVVRSPADVERSASGGDPLVLDAMQHGVVLYSAAA